MASLLLGAILVFSILSIHTVLLKERQRIENIEQQILTQQKQWSEIYVKSREEDKANVSLSTNDQYSVQKAKNKWFLIDVSDQEAKKVFFDPLIRINEPKNMVLD